MKVQSKGQTAIIAGDMMHHQLQCLDPTMSTIFCWDAKEAALSRKRVFEEVAETDTLLLPIHFPTPTAGRLKRAGQGFDWIFKRD